jgi:hypothetical protein
MCSGASSTAWAARPATAFTSWSGALACAAVMGMMDRGNTAISQLKPGDVDWDKIFSPKGEECAGFIPAA